MRKWFFIVPPLLALLIGAGLGLLLRPPSDAETGPNPMTIANATLLSVREQGREIVFVGRFAAIVTATEGRMGFTARKTLILPGQVRYAVDLSRLRRSDLAWDAETATLTVTLPPLEVAGPQIDFNAAQEYSDGGLMLTLTGAEQNLDETNRRAAQEELTRQARGPLPMTEARNAALRDVARSFALPLRAAGIEASVAARFVGADGRETASFLDRPRRIDDRIRARNP
ncbi:MAG TPA: DUF4230 domain-containing protein [Allosphingosinicella sp.]|nr:DUF4230 domain-containing protein [Allosphingosinicella sp.]